MLHNGIIIPRDITNSWLWGDSDRLKWWLDLLLHANVADRVRVKDGTRYVLCRGEYEASVSFLCNRWGVGRDRVMKFLSMLVADGKISRRVIGRSVAIIKIEGFDSYQQQMLTAETDKGEKTQKLPDTLADTLISSQQSDKQQITKVENSEADTLADTLPDTLADTLISSQVIENDSSYKDEQNTNPTPNPTQNIYYKDSPLIIYKKQKNENSGVAHVKEVIPEVEGDNFQPPTEDEVKAYFEINALRADPTTFFWHYSALGWRCGNTRVYDWRAMARKWSVTEGTRKTVQPQRNTATDKRHEIEQLSKNFDDLWK